MIGYLALAVKLPATCSVAMAGLCAYGGSAWYVWGAFLLAGLLLNNTVTVETR